MRVQEYSVEELNSMPLTMLRNLDVGTQEEEITLQAVVNEKMKSQPIENLPELTIEEQKLLDSPMLTPEKEKEIQAALDGRRAKYRAIVVGETVPSIESLELPSDEPTPEEVPDEDEPEPEVTDKVKFCEYCSAKKVKHMKNCTRKMV